MKLFLTVCCFICLWSELYAVSIDELKAMTPEDKKSFFSQEIGKELNDGDDFIPAMLIGLRDENVEVQKLALSNVAYVVPMLQKMKANGAEMPFDLSLMEELRDVLIDNLYSDDAQVRSASIHALVYSDAPNKQIESTLIQKFESENDPQVKGSILDSLINAGYDSDRVGSVLVESMNSENRYIVSSAAKGIEVLTPDGGLEALEAHLNIDSLIRLRLIVKAVAAYGDLAKIYLPELNKILNNPNIDGSIVSDLERAIVAIKDPAKLSTRKVSKALNLSAPSAVSLSKEPRKASSAVREIVKNTQLEVKELAEELPTELFEKSAEQSSNWRLLLIGAVVVVGGILMLHKKIH